MNVEQRVVFFLHLMKRIIHCYFSKSKNSEEERGFPSFPIREGQENV